MLPLLLLLIGCSGQEEIQVSESPIPTVTATALPTPTEIIPSILPYIEQAYSLLDEIPQIIDNANEIEIAVLKSAVTTISKDELSIFAFSDWIPVDVPDEETREMHVSEEYVSNILYAVLIGGVENCFVISSDCKTIWAETISYNHGYERWLEYQIPESMAQALKTFYNEKFPEYAE
jgi:hypothetical protein